MGPHHGAPGADRAEQRRRRCRGKSPPPPGGGGNDPSVDDDKILTGDDAEQALRDDRRRSISRRDLERNPNFDDVSPQLGELDVEAFEELFDDAPDDALELLARMSQATDRDLAALARRLAGRLMLDLARTGEAKSRGVGRLTVARADESSSDIDIDSSLDGILGARSERRPVALDDLFTSRWQQPATAICLLVDRSGSMNGARLASAALAAAVCAWRAPKQFAVVAFGDRAIEIKGLLSTKPAETVVSEVLALRGHGTTDVALALQAAQRQLATSSATRRITLLLSDAEVTTGGDPVPIARSLDELLVLAPSDELEHARRLIEAAGGRLAEVGTPMSVLGALRRVLQ
ncbi:MAG: vWA domain-containing protein [Acidimicrobiales bacterium]